MICNVYVFPSLFPRNSKFIFDNNILPVEVTNEDISKLLLDEKNLGIEAIEDIIQPTNSLTQ